MLCLKQAAYINQCVSLVRGSETFCSDFGPYWLTVWTKAGENELKLTVNGQSVIQTHSRINSLNIRYASFSGLHEALLEQIQQTKTRLLFLRLISNICSPCFSKATADKTSLWLQSCLAPSPTFREVLWARGRSVGTSLPRVLVASDLR